jgi:hypothetical protein
MPVRSAPLPSVSPAEMEFLISRTGMHLNAGQVADLVLAWRQVSAVAATIPRKPIPADDFAFAFRLPPPGSGPRSKAKTVKTTSSQAKSK